MAIILSGAVQPQQSTYSSEKIKVRIEKTKKSASVVVRVFTDDEMEALLDLIIIGKATPQEYRICKRFFFSTHGLNIKQLLIYNQYEQ